MACTGTKWERKPVDWLAGALIGVSILSTIWVAMIVFGIWRRCRFAHRPANPARHLIMLLLWLAHLALVPGVCEALLAGIKASA